MEFSKEEVQELKEALLRARALAKRYTRLMEANKDVLTSAEYDDLNEYRWLNLWKVDVILNISAQFDLGLS